MGLFAESAPAAEQYMGGGLFSKAMDILGTGNYAAAGAANALLQGQSPLEGISEGIQSRTTFSDVLTNAGAPDNFLTHAAGFAGDIFLDPTNLLLGAGVISHSRQLAKATLGGVEALTGLEKVGDLARGMDIAMQNVAEAKKLAQTANKRIPGGIARKAYAEAIGQAATKAGLDPTEIASAARAAREAGIAQHLEMGFTIEQAKAEGRVAQRAYLNSMLGEDAHKTVKQTQRDIIGAYKRGNASREAAAIETRNAWQAKQGSLGEFVRNWVQDTEKAIKQQPDRYGMAGKLMVDLVAGMHTLSDAWTGAKFSHQTFDLLPKLNKADIELLDSFGRAMEDGRALDVPDHIKQGYSVVRELLDSVGQDAFAVKLSVVDQALTAKFTALTENYQKNVRRWIAKPQLMEKVRKTADNVAAMQVAQDILAAGGGLAPRLDYPAVIRDFKPRQNYWLRKMDDKAFEALRADPKGEIGQRIVAEIVNRHGISEEAAWGQLKQHLSIGRATPRDIRMGNLQFSRELPIPEDLLDKNLGQNLMQYIQNTGLRIAGAQVFGGRDELAKDLLLVARQNGFDHDGLTKLFLSAVNGPEPLDNFMKVVSNASTVRYLGPRTALSQFLQFPNAVGAFGLKNAVAGLGAWLSSGGRRYAREIGATLADMTELYGGSGRFAENFLRTTGMPAMDYGMRVVSSTAARAYAEQAAGEIYKLRAAGKKGPQVEQWVRGLQRLGVSEQTVLEQAGRLSPEQLRMASLVGSAKTQFASHVSDLPMAYQQKWGRFILKFKTFTLQSGKFLDDVLLAEAKKGNLMPAARWAASMGLVGSPVWAALRQLQRDPKDPNALEALKTIYFTGALGAVADYTQALSQGDKNRALSAMVGPNLGIISEAAALPAKIIQGKASLSDVPLNYFQQARNLWNNTQE